MAFLGAALDWLTAEHDTVLVVDDVHLLDELVGFAAGPVGAEAIGADGGQRQGRLSWCPTRSPRYGRTVIRSASIGGPSAGTSASGLIFKQALGEPGGGGKR